MTLKPPGLEIRSANAADAAALARLRSDSAVERKGDAARSYDEHVRAYTAFFARELAAANSFLRSWVAVLDGEIVGSASLTVVPTMPRYGRPESSARDGRIRDVYVVSAQRRRGIARSLLQSLLVAADAERLSRLTLGATPAGMPLYRSLGFTLKGDEMVYASAP